MRGKYVPGLAALPAIIVALPSMDLLRLLEQRFPSGMKTVTLGRRQTAPGTAPAGAAQAAAGPWRLQTWQAQPSAAAHQAAAVPPPETILRYVMSSEVGNVRLVVFNSRAATHFTTAQSEACIMLDSNMRTLPGQLPATVRLTKKGCSIRGKSFCSGHQRT